MKIAYRAVMLATLCLGVGASSALADCAGVIKLAYKDILGRPPTTWDLSTWKSKCMVTVRILGGTVLREPNSTQLSTFNNILRLSLRDSAEGIAYAKAQLAAAAAAADAVAGTEGNWAVCRGDGLHVCDDAVLKYPLYFANHQICQRTIGCLGEFYTCNSACPPPSSSDAGVAYPVTVRCWGSDNTATPGLKVRIVVSNSSLSPLEQSGFTDSAGRALFAFKNNTTEANGTFAATCGPWPDGGSASQSGAIDGGLGLYTNVNQVPPLK